MLDINLFREEKGGDPEKIRESQRRRYINRDDKDDKVALVDKVIDLDKLWREARFKVDRLKKDLNKISKDIGAKMKAKEDATELKNQSIAIKAQIIEAETAEQTVATERDQTIKVIGNLVHDSVPVHDDEANNVVVKEWGKFEKQAHHRYNHVDLVKLLDIVDLDNGSVVAGGRGYYLRGAGVLLNQALINCAIQHGFKRGSEPIQTPFFMRKAIMGECAQLKDFDEALYHVSGEGDDKYLIATSEQPLCALHRQQWFEVKDLPKRYIGYSTCFRKEAGSHGRDTLGIFRVHQFEKVEQFVMCSPDGDTSWKMMDEMLQSAEEFYQGLELPYRVVNIVSGELNDAAAKKYDLEAWFPGGATPEHRELVSCSNCTDYQARRLEVRLRTAKQAGVDASKAYVHLLNSTMTASERTLCCLLENHQKEDGVSVPEVLQPFMMGMTFIPFKKKFDSKGKLIDLPEPEPESS